jgi:hypothetical protein
VSQFLAAKLGGRLETCRQVGNLPHTLAYGS